MTYAAAVAWTDADWQRVYKGTVDNQLMYTTMFKLNVFSAITETLMLSPG